jgi:hypothetical protein
MTVYWSVTPSRYFSLVLVHHLYNIASNVIQVLLNFTVLGAFSIIVHVIIWNSLQFIVCGAVSLLPYLQANNCCLIVVALIG